MSFFRGAPAASALTKEEKVQAKEQATAELQREEDEFIRDQ